MDRRTFLKAGATAMVMTPETMREQLEHPRQPRGPGAVFYRRILGAAQSGYGTLGFTSVGLFKIPPHPSSALSLESLCFTWPDGVFTGFAANDSLVAWVTLAAFQDAAFVSPSGQILRWATWIFGGAANNFGGLNPPGKASLDLSPPLRLSPADDPCFVMLADNKTTSSPNLLQAKCVVEGWEIPTGPTGTFPRPDSFEGVL